ncbi:MAG: hypothetical protein HZC22_04620 [Rhodocyclales bacterium]|jgi:hypothetical protein|nr:hypothetical protein [Rhodocyclales bacterium]
MKVLIGTIAIIFSTTAIAQDRLRVKLDCAKESGYITKAERSYMASFDTYGISIEFTAVKPDDKLVDKVLRECIAISLKLNDKKDMFAFAFFSPGGGRDIQTLNPYGESRALTYTAKDKSIAVREMKQTR